jgi:hypothetical protein
MMEDEFNKMVERYQVEMKETVKKIEQSEVKPATVQLGTVKSNEFDHRFLHLGIFVFLFDFLQRTGNITDWKWYVLFFAILYAQTIFKGK